MRNGNIHKDITSRTVPVQPHVSASITERLFDPCFLYHTFPSVRPRSHPILSERLTCLISTGISLIPNEWLFDDDAFAYNISLTSTRDPALFCVETLNRDDFSCIVTLRVFCSQLSSLWNSGAKELVSHFFPTSVCALRVKNSSTGSFLSKLPLQDAAKGLPDTIASCFEPSEAHCDSTVKVNELDVNVPGDAEHQVFLNLDLDVTTIVGNVDEADALGQRLGYIRSLLLLGPIFKHFRRALYKAPALLIAEPRVQLCPDEVVWILPRDTEFSITIWDRRNASWSTAYQSFVTQVASDVTLALENKIPLQSGKTRSRRLSLLAQQIGPRLRFHYYAERPSPDVHAWCSEHQSEIPSGGHWYHFNALRLQNTRDAELLSLAKMVIGVRKFLSAAFQNQQESLKYEIKAAALDIASLGRISGC